MKLLFVVQRYGDGIIGGAELHCRLLAERLAASHEVEIATTCSADYLTWENTFPEGRTTVGSLPVRRFEVIRRRPADFDAIAHNTLYGHPGPADERAYLDAHGPVCPGLIAYLKERVDIDIFILFSYRYWTTHQALRVVGRRSILVPTAEHDRTLYLRTHRESFRLPAAIAYNSPEERALINRLADNGDIPGIVVGTGLPDVPDLGGDEDISNVLDITPPYFLYVGRIERAKGCASLLAYYDGYIHAVENAPVLVMAGKREMAVPGVSHVRLLGVIGEAEKGLAFRHAIALIMPSRHESLSMVVLEAWRAGRPVLCNGDCEVLRGQCVRSNGGLYYRSSEEFIAGAALLARRKDLREHLGRQGKSYYETNYTWPSILAKYDRLLAMAAGE